MFSLFAHHAEAFLKVEVNGRDYPDGMTEHVIFYALGVSALILTSYSIYAGLRDFRRWNRSPAAVKA